MAIIQSNFSIGVRGYFNQCFLFVNTASNISQGNFLHAFPNLQVGQSFRRGYFIEVITFTLISSMFRARGYLLPQVVILLIGNLNNLIKRGIFQNYLSSLARHFGVEARQDKDNLYIKKRNLPKLTPKQINTSESLLIGIFLHVMIYESNTLTSRIAIEFFGSNFFLNNNNVKKIQHIILIWLYIKAKYSYPSPGYEYGTIQNANTFITPTDFE